MTDLAIIIPTYNSEKHLQECLNSIYAQTLQPDLIIFVDNSSTDKTLDIIDTVPNKLVLRGTHNINIGQSRNSGLVAAAAKQIGMVAMIDSDDTIDPQYLWHMTMLYNYAETDWVTSSYMRSDGIWVDLMENATSQQEREQNRLSAFILASPIDLLVAGGYSPLAIAEDWELWYRLLNLGYKYAVNHEGGYNYRVHSGSSSAIKTPQLIDGNTRKLMDAETFTW